MAKNEGKFFCVLFSCFLVFPQPNYPHTSNDRRQGTILPWQKMNDISTVT